MVGKESLAKRRCQEFVELIFLQHSNKKTGLIALAFCPGMNWFQLGHHLSIGGCFKPIKVLGVCQVGRSV